VIEISAALDTDGRIAHWEHHNYIPARRHPCALPTSGPDRRHHVAQSPLRQGSYRALAHGESLRARNPSTHRAPSETDPLSFACETCATRAARAVLEAPRNGLLECQRDAPPAPASDSRSVFDKGGYWPPREIAIGSTSGRVGCCASSIVRVWRSREPTTSAIRSKADRQGLGGALFEAVRSRRENLQTRALAISRARSANAPQIDVVLLDRKDSLPLARPGADRRHRPGIGSAISSDRGPPAFAPLHRTD